jgi:hypothetical protein
MFSITSKQGLEVRSFGLKRASGRTKRAYERPSNQALSTPGRSYISRFGNAFETDIVVCIYIYHRVMGVVKGEVG